MTKYILRRLIQSVFVVFGVTLLSFLSLHLSGDPTYLYISDRATPEEIEQVRRAYGFDRPVIEQYLSYLARLARGDMGDSLSARVPALGLVLERLPATIELTLSSMFISVLLALPIGILAALRRGSGVDRGLMLVAILGQSVPAFWLGIMLMLFFGLSLRWLPISGYTPILDPLVKGEFSRLFDTLGDALRHLLLPSFTIAVFSFSRNARLLRSTMLEILSQDFIRTGRSKGLRERMVVVRHALPNVLIPFITVLGLEFGFLLSGVVVVETVFSWPGIGRLVFTAINQRDIPVVQVAVTLFSIIFIVLNLLTDLLYAQFDPRVRLE